MGRYCAITLTTNNEVNSFVWRRLSKEAISVRPLQLNEHMKGNKTRCKNSSTENSLFCGMHFVYRKTIVPILLIHFLSEVCGIQISYSLLGSASMKERYSW